MAFDLCDPPSRSHAVASPWPCSDGDEVQRSAADLDIAFSKASPRRSPSATHWPSLLIHGAVLAFFFLLLFRAFSPNGLLSWSAGLIYISYDTLLTAFVFVMTLPLIWRKATPSSISPMPTLAALVACYNEDLNIRRMIRSLLAQSDPIETILIVDDGSDDGTADILTGELGLSPPPLGSMSAPSALHPTLRWLRLPRMGKARALNAALVAVDSDVIVTVDGDTFLDQGATGAMKAAFARDPNLVAATGVLTPVCDATLSGRFFQWFQTYEYIRNFLARYAWARADSLLLISGACAGFRRKAIVAVGGFDPDCLVEDYELIHRLRRFGADHGQRWTTGVVADAKATTEAPSTAASFFRQRRRWFGGFLQTQFLYRSMVGNSRYGRVGVLMLPVKALDTLQPIYGLIALGLLPFYAATGHLRLLFPIGAWILAKIAIDFAFGMWSIYLYRRWADPASSARVAVSLLASFIEPFTYQAMRHFGAALGWLTFLRGDRWNETAR
jgi:cellulose synthase/poly-beta-1,6-N-acetylglucosamine synthase-like glycosyltransferase